MKTKATADLVNDDEDTGGRVDRQLRVLTGPTDKKMADKIFDTYIRRDDESYARHPEFMLALDRLLSEIGGKAVDAKKKPVEDEDDFDDDEVEEIASNLVDKISKRTAKKI